MPISFADFLAYKGHEKYGHVECSNSLVRTQFLLIFPFVFYEIRVILPIVWILFFIDWVHPTSIVPISMGMVHLCFTIIQETLSELRNAICCPDIQIKGIEFVRNALGRFGNTQFVAFDFIRRPNKYSEVLRHLTFNSYSKV